MKWKKWLIIIGIVLAILAVRAHYVVMRGNWNWHIPDALLQRINFDRLIENADAMLADGYEDRSDQWTKDSNTYAVFSKGVEPNTVVWLYLIKDVYSSEPWSGIRGEGATLYEKDTHSYNHLVRIHSDMGRLWLILNTEHPLDGCRQAVDFLNDFCERYCDKTAI